MKNKHQNLMRDVFELQKRIDLTVNRFKKALQDQAFIESQSDSKFQSFLSSLLIPCDFGSASPDSTPESFKDLEK